MGLFKTLCSSDTKKSSGNSIIFLKTESSQKLAKFRLFHRAAAYSFKPVSYLLVLKPVSFEKFKKIDTCACPRVKADSAGDEILVCGYDNVVL